VVSERRPKRWIQPEADASVAGLGRWIVYNVSSRSWHKRWYGQADLEPGHVKWLGFASGYGAV